tara:strand:+ start:1086 stop:2468 length:1383 start_codon:yes stop_codon:yes gene_type:complete
MIYFSDKEKRKFLNELYEFLKIPSISADPNHQKEMVKCSNWLESCFKNSGCENVRIIKTKGHPIVYADKFIDKSLPTILVYGHYDVQPPDPISLWDSPPFEPVVKKTKIHPEGAIFARGACDDKGQMFMHIKALEWIIKKNKLNFNIKFLIEGEEEVGSDNLETFISKNKDLLNSDIILISDTSMKSNTIPSITSGLRGISYMEIKLKGPNRDLHSGTYGGGVANPINILSKLIASMHDENMKITIPGFYDKVVDLNSKDKKEILKAAVKTSDFKKSIGIKELYGDVNFSLTERISTRPTLDVNGIYGGYIGEGSKTVLPSEAHAKISMRLVPKQDWKEISELFKKYVVNFIPKNVTATIKTHHGAEPYVTPTNSPAYDAALMAYKKSFGVNPFQHRGGGSIPIVPIFERELGVKSILMGFGLDSDAIHSPNEHFGLFNFFKGIETIIYFYEFYAKKVSR